MPFGCCEHLKVMIAIMPMLMVRPMTVAVPAHGNLPIGAGLGVERTRHDARLRAQAADHVGDDVIFPYVDDACGDLGRQMAIAEVPGDAREQPRLAASDLEQTLRRRLDGDDAPIFEADAVAGAQQRCVRQIE